MPVGVDRDDPGAGVLARTDRGVAIQATAMQLRHIGVCRLGGDLSQTTSPALVGPLSCEQQILIFAALIETCMQTKIAAGDHEQ